MLKIINTFVFCMCFIQFVFLINHNWFLNLDCNFNLLNIVAKTYTPEGYCIFQLQRNFIPILRCKASIVFRNIFFWYDIHNNPAWSPGNYRKGSHDQLLCLLSNKKLLILLCNKLKGNLVRTKVIFSEYHCPTVLLML